MISLRKIINYSFYFILFLLLGIFIFYFISQSRLESTFRNVLSQGNERLNSWHRVFDLSERVKNSFNRLIINKDSNIMPLVEELEAIRIEVNKLEASEFISDRNNAKELESAVRKCKSALFGFRRELEAGYFGTNYLTVHEATLSAAIFISEKANKAMAEALFFLEENNKNILKSISSTNTVAVRIFLSLVALMGLSVLTVKNLIVRFVAVLLLGIENIAGGNLSFRISGRYGLGMDKIAASFNKMIANWEAAEGKVFKAHKILSKITDGLEEEIFLSGQDQKIIWANKKFIDSRNLPEADIVGSYCYKVVHGFNTPCQARACLTFPADEPECCPFKKAKETKRSCTVVQVCRDKQGKEFYSECSVFPLLDKEGNLEEYIHIIRDITKRMALEEEMKENILALEKSRQEFQRKVSDSGKFIKVAVDRELRMVELKTKIAELQAKISNKG